MPDQLTSQIERILESRKERHTLRTLKINNLIDFSSNDYLGLAHSEHLNKSIQSHSLNGLGSTGSRLLSGHSQESVELERFLANFHNAPDALLFNSGFDANYGVYSCLPQPGDAVFYDELIHASVHAGMRASQSKYIKPFQHNDLEHLLDLINTYKDVHSGNIFIAVESLYSMDGCWSNLKEIVELIQKMDSVYLIIDEAHSTGIIGDEGRGLACHLKVENKILVRVHTFGKAVGCHGAVVLCSSLLKQYFVNYSKPVIFSTFLPAHSLFSIKCAYEYFIKHNYELTLQLDSLIQRFRSGVKSKNLLESDSPIQGLVVPGNVNVIKAAEYLQKMGFGVYPIRSPSVPKGTERIRICIHAHNTISEVDGLVDAINSLERKLNPQKIVDHSIPAKL
ncbi:hypothetical protein HDV06_002663 [Boothiomyces sp. JEL0866]|nr:hypothetical protein HDV06_002663 [Boothiomyces sp. JEL0866]